VSTPLEPHEVDKPYLRRWLRDTLELFVRSPVRFGMLKATNISMKAAPPIVRALPVAAAQADPISARTAR
jgi:hypothetical protein